MTYSGSGDTGGAWRNDGGVQPHAFDPVAQPELFNGVLTKRVFAFLIDLVVLVVPVVLGYLFIVLFGLRDARPRLGAVLAGMAGLGGLGARLLRRDAGRAAFGHASACA